MSQIIETNKTTEKIFHFNDLIIKRLQLDKLNLDHVFILRCLYNRESSLLNIYSENFTNERVIGFIGTLERKKFVFVQDDFDSVQITQDGAEYYESLHVLSTGKSINNKLIAKKIRQEGFDEWWALYPANSKWEDSTTGTKFTELRPLRTGKEQCRKKYDNLINSGAIKHHELIDCLKYEIKARKIDSLKKNANQMCFMKNSLSYLNQEAYIAYIDEVRNNPGFIQDCKDCHENDDISISHDDIYESNTELGN